MTDPVYDLRIAFTHSVCVSPNHVGWETGWMCLNPVMSAWCLSGSCVYSVCDACFSVLLGLIDQECQNLARAHCPFAASTPMYTFKLVKPRYNRLRSTMVFSGILVLLIFSLVMSSNVIRDTTFPHIFAGVSVLNYVNFLH